MTSFYFLRGWNKLVTSRTWHFRSPLIGQRAMRRYVKKSHKKQPATILLAKLDIIFHQPRFPWNRGTSLTKPTFGVRSREVTIICPDSSSSKSPLNFIMVPQLPNALHKKKQRRPQKHCPMVPGKRSHSWLEYLQFQVRKIHRLNERVTFLQPASC